MHLPIQGPIHEAGRASAGLWFINPQPRILATLGPLMTKHNYKMRAWLYCSCNMQLWGCNLFDATNFFGAAKVLQACLQTSSLQLFFGISLEEIWWSRYLLHAKPSHAFAFPIPVCSQNRQQFPFSLSCELLLWRRLNQLRGHRWVTMASWSWFGLVGWEKLLVASLFLVAMPFAPSSVLYRAFSVRNICPTCYSS